MYFYLVGRSLLSPLMSNQLWYYAVMALMLKMLNVTLHVDPYLHVHHPRYLLCMSTDVILAGWQETFRSTASRLAADLKVSCQPAGRRHFLNKNKSLLLVLS